MLTVEQLVHDVATAIRTVDSRRPQAANVRSGDAYLPGIGPFPEAKAVDLIARELTSSQSAIYGRALTLGVPYPGQSRQKCDLCIGESPNWDLAVEIKLLRMMGDNGKPNANMLMHILSPYPVDRSALTDCTKLAESQLHGRKAILIYGFEFAEYPLVPAIEAFEVLAAQRVRLGPRASAPFRDLVHPVHCEGAVFGWEISPRRG